MVYHMKTTLMIPDSVYVRLKRRAAREGTTISALVTEYLRLGLRSRAAAVELEPLPSFDAGKAAVDVADRDALFRVMETT